MLFARLEMRGSSIRTWSDNFFECIVSPALKKFEYEDPIRADKISTPGSISLQIYENLFNSDLVIADLTDYNPNVFYELAIRHMTEKPVIHMIKNGQKLPFDNQDNRTIYFDAIAKNAYTARKMLEKQIEALEKGNAYYNPITAVKIISKGKSSENTDEQFKAEVLENISALNNKVEQLTARNNEMRNQLYHASTVSVPLSTFAGDPSGNLNAMSPIFGSGNSTTLSVPLTYDINKKKGV